MTTINRKVIDLSHWNTVNDLSAVKNAGIVGVIHKATEGNYYKDDKYNGRKNGFLELGLKWGAYHFGNSGNVAAQVDYFLNFVGIDDSTLYALDWENDPNGHTMSLSQAKEFMQRVDDRVGENRCVLYSGNTAKEALGNSVDAFMGAHRLWLAQYSSTPSWQRSWQNFWIWQYSDGANGPQPHNCPGCQNPTDTNSWSGSDEELRAQWSGKAGAPPVEEVPPPDTSPQPTETVNITASAGVTITINGIKVYPLSDVR